jgi:MFS family permease
MTRLGRAFLKLWSASVISNLGDGVRLAALPLLAASLTDDPRVIALVAAVSGLPWLMFSLVSGALVDRIDRRRVMITVDAARAVLVALLALALVADVADVTSLLVLAFALGLGETFFDTAAPAMTAAIVPNDRLESANARLLAANTLATSSSVRRSGPGCSQSPWRCRSRWTRRPLRSPP